MVLVIENVLKQEEKVEKVTFVETDMDDISLKTQAIKDLLYGIQLRMQSKRG